MLFFAARAGVINVLGFADQRLVPWRRNCFRNNKPVQSKIISYSISLAGAETWQ